MNETVLLLVKGFYHRCHVLLLAIVRLERKNYIDALNLLTDLICGSVEVNVDAVCLDCGFLGSGLVRLQVLAGKRLHNVPAK